MCPALSFLASSANSRWRPPGDRRQPVLEPSAALPGSTGLRAALLALAVVGFLRLVVFPWASVHLHAGLG
jgi:hypothetical protein